MLNLHLRWSLAQQLFRQAINFLVYLGAARFVAPDNFGALSIAMVWIAAGSVLLDFGFAPALVQKLKISSEQLEGVFLLNVLTGALLAVFFFFIAPLIAEAYKEPLLESLVRGLSILFPINALTIIPSVFISREMNFKGAALRDLAASAISGLIFYISYLAELGVWSLVAQMVSSSLLILVFSWGLITWRPKFDYKKIGAVKGLLQFSSNMFAFSLFKFIAQNIDLALIGYFLGPTSAGIYGMGSRIISSPFSSLRVAVGSYLFPKFSSIQNNPGKVLNLFVTGNRKLAIVLGYIVIFIYLATPIAVPILFKESWKNLSDVVMGLAIIGFLQSIIAPTGELMKSLGRPQWLLRWGIFFSALLTISVVIGVNWGINGAIQAIVISHFIGMLVCALSVKKYFQDNYGIRYLDYLMPVIFLIYTIYLMFFLDDFITIFILGKFFITLAIFSILNIAYSRFNNINFL